MIDNYMLYSNIPILDLHGNDRFSAIYMANEFIDDNIKLNNKLIKIVHGKGEGILRDELHKFLKTKREVKEYKLDIFNSGTTIIELN